MADVPALPPGFRFGVATAGFQVEGGYNGRGQPANNWSWWEAAGRVERSGRALDFWNRFDHYLDRARAAGCDAFRLSVEWARCEPLDGQVDDAALERYARILDACHDRGLRPLVTLHHFCHPAWLGVDFWPRLDAPERFAEWAAIAVDRLAGRCRHWLTLAGIDTYAVRSYLTGAFPPGRRLHLAPAIRALDHMLAAHVLAYEAIKQRQPQAVVAIGLSSRPIYELSRLLLDVLLARRQGVGRHDLSAWLATRRDEFHAGALPPPSALERLLRRVGASAVPSEQALPRAVAAVYGSPHERAVDVAYVTSRGPTVEPAPLALLVETGLRTPTKGGRPVARRDGWTRPRFLRASLAAVVDALDAGVPVCGYYHWTLGDAYEWGTYARSFGLYDSAGGDEAARAYRGLADALRRGDRSVLR